jgi:hypothetical protein
MNLKHVATRIDEFLSAVENGARVARPLLPKKTGPVSLTAPDTTVGRHFQARSHHGTKTNH